MNEKVIITSECEICEALERKNKTDYLNFVRTLLGAGCIVNVYKTTEYQYCLRTLESTEQFDEYLELCKKKLVKTDKKINLQHKTFHQN